jgi:hypothetical protein
MTLKRGNTYHIQSAKYATFSTMPEKRDKDIMRLRQRDPGALSGVSFKHREKWRFWQGDRW